MLTLQDLWTRVHTFTRYGDVVLPYHLAFHALECGASPGLWLLFSTWMADADIRNGGFDQYFYNDTCFGVEGAMIGFLTIGETEASRCVAQALLHHLTRGPDPRFVAENTPRLPVIKKLGVMSGEPFSVVEDTFYGLEYNLETAFLDFAAYDPDAFLPRTDPPPPEVAEYVRNPPPPTILHTGAVDNGPPCPQCQKPLRTPRSRQCRHCGADWH